ncbi:MAG TPA: hypothetical protein VG275_07085 [Solirubrobacteraceae bacterium]|jgi:hypothetical protein|nr:hypothetical protein [Solirubrobacteraceae bacterium]
MIAASAFSLSQLLHPLSQIYRWLVHGDGYQISSGPIIVLSAWGYAAVWLRRHNCHEPRCWRLQWHVHPDHGHPVCRHHHPHDPRNLQGDPSP